MSPKRNADWHEIRTLFKATSGLALSTFSFAIVSAFLPPPPPKHLPTPATGTVGWDPCLMWVQYGPMERLTVLICFGAFVLFAVRGLRNRPGPRWFAIVGLVALIQGIASEWWRIAGECYSKASLICSFTWFSAVGLMFLHHAVQPRVRPVAPYQGTKLLTVAYSGILPVFVSLPVACSALNQLSFLGYQRNEQNFLHAALTAFARYLGWTEVLLLPIVAVIGFHWLCTRTPSAKHS